MYYKIIIDYKCCPLQQVYSNEIFCHIFSVYGLAILISGLIKMCEF